MFFIALFFLCWTVICLSLFVWKRTLLVKTWQEPYFAETPIIIESDDWGPGGAFHADRLNVLLDALASHKDSINRPALLTGNVVLSVPDVEKIMKTPNGNLSRKMLDREFPQIYNSMLRGVENGTFVPQLHGLEHLNAEAFAMLCRTSDPRTDSSRSDFNWWDWESLDSPLQGHYVDGSKLPSKAIDAGEAEKVVKLAAEQFVSMFGKNSMTAVAPCYLWNDTIEHYWEQQSIKAIQTAGYRCNARSLDGKYIQDKVLIRAGDKNENGQKYLVRNVMFEPVDGKNTPETAFQEALQARRQALPLTISTHRYNFTRTEQEFKTSLTGLNILLNKLTENFPKTRFLSSAELAEFLFHPELPITNHFNNQSFEKLSQHKGIKKLSPFLYRLYYRHRKLALLSYLSGLIIPAWLICKTADWKS